MLVQIACVTADECNFQARGSALVRESVIEQTHDAAVLVSGSDATFEGVVVRRSWPQPGNGVFGRGIHVQRGCTGPGCDPAAHAAITVRGSRVEETYEMGILAVNSSLTVEGTWVKTIAPRSNNIFGDGLCVVDESSGLAQVSVAASRIEGAARAGISDFGGTVAVATTAIACAAFPLNGESFGASQFVFQDLGHNGCGCPVASRQCTNVSVGLEAPDAQPVQ
jgi:hypothetical protein